MITNEFTQLIIIIVELGLFLLALPMALFTVGLIVSYIYENKTKGYHDDY